MLMYFQKRPEKVILRCLNSDIGKKASFVENKSQFSNQNSIGQMDEKKFEFLEKRLPDQVKSEGERPERI